MYEDLFLAADALPFRRRRWDLDAVAFTDEPPESAFERASAFLAERGFVPLDAPSGRRFTRGSRPGAWLGPRARDVPTRLAIDHTRPGVYRVCLSIPVRRYLVSGPERGFRRAERDALVFLLEGYRSERYMAGLADLETRADAACKADVMQGGAMLAGVIASTLVMAWALATQPLGLAMFFPWVIALGIMIGSYQGARGMRQVWIGEPVPAQLLSLEELTRAIGGVGYWRTWSTDYDTRFDALFSHVQMWSPHDATGFSFANPLGLRFHRPAFVAFLTAWGAGPESTASWPDELKAGQFPCGLRLAQGGLHFVRRWVLEGELAQCAVQQVIGSGLPPEAEGDLCFLLTCGPVGLAVVAEGVSILTAMGEVSLKGARVLYDRWSWHWQMYWQRRVRDLDVPYDPVCELVLPMHPDLAEQDAMLLPLAAALDP